MIVVIVPVVEAVKGTNVEVGAENMYFEEKGAYTGEVSAAMLVDAGVKYVIIGHSEKRLLQGRHQYSAVRTILQLYLRLQSRRT